jgi:putative Mg2+ transporter-C (MgtC) family protein
MDVHKLGDVLLRLLAASLLGALLGVERQMHGRWVGLRTHMMVALGAAIFVAAVTQLSGPPVVTETGALGTDAVSRVIQGIAAGVGFLGAGTILKLTEHMEIKGLTTASSIWLAAAVGTAAGLALYWLAVAGTLISLVVLAVLRPLEKRFERGENSKTMTTRTQPPLPQTKAPPPETRP